MNETKFENLDDETQKAPDVLKDMVVSEVDFIRDTMQIVGMFLGEYFVAAGTLIQGAIPDDTKSVNK